MLAIRMQRTGRKGHAMFRMVVQDSRRTPTSGKVVAQLGSYDPHGKAMTLDKEKVSFYLEHGAQPSERVARLLKGEGVKLPDWVNLSADKQRTIRNADKRRSTRPPEPEAEVVPAEAVSEASAESSEAVTPDNDAQATETADNDEAPAVEQAPKAEAAEKETPAEAETTPPEDTETSQPEVETAGTKAEEPAAETDEA